MIRENGIHHAISRQISRQTLATSPDVNYEIVDDRSLDIRNIGQKKQPETYQEK